MRVVFTLGYGMMVKFIPAKWKKCSLRDRLVIDITTKEMDQPLLDPPACSSLWL